MGKNSNNEHFYVAIGASAGGLEAIHDFFDHMPDAANLSFVVVQHLSSDYKSLLVELVSKHTHMKVYEANHNMVVAKGCVYIIPNDKIMTIAEGRIVLAEKGNIKGPNTAIDSFFISLAQDRKQKSIAIILSGTGSDGTRGIEAIKESGGLVIVQEPDTAKFNGMPNSAIASGLADYVLSPENIPGIIFQHIKQKPIEILGKGGANEAHLSEIYKLIFQQTGLDFHYYKTPTIIRRIAKRMGSLNIAELTQYVEYLGNNPEECKNLSKDFLIGVTKFFRDDYVFDAIKKVIIPKVIATKAEGEILKVWIAACSSGEEVYSIAMLLEEYMEKKKLQLDLKIFATDIDTEAISKASKGSYPYTIKNDIPADLLQKYFIQEGKRFVVGPRLRKRIVFARHNIIKDPPFIKNDMVFCRNMLIYMNSILQKKILNTFYFALNDKAFLVLGTSETVASMKSSFDEIDPKAKIYQKNSYSNPQIQANIPSPVDSTRYSKIDLPIKKKEVLQKSTVLIEGFKDVMAEDHGYAAVMIDKNYEIKEATGDFRRFLRLPDKMNLHLLKMVSPDLSAALNSMIRKSWKENIKVVHKSVREKIGEESRFISATIKPIGEPGIEQLTLIVLGECKNEMIQYVEPTADHTNHSNQEYIFDLESELKETRINLQMAIEGLETANEELQSSNEELLSANEELQSSNEELQSLNEELHTLNTEHQLKIRELVELNDDLNNYFKSVEIGQVFLDNNLNIRKFNPAAVNLINLIDSDIGRPISHISNNIRHDGLHKDLKEVMNTGKQVEQEVQLTNGRIMLMKVLPYIRQDRQRDGIVITFVDVSAMKALNNIITGVFNASPNAILAMNVEDENWKIIANNDAAKKLMNDRGEPFFIQDERVMKHILKVFRQGETIKEEVHLQNSNLKEWYDLMVVKMENIVVLSLTDITDKKESEEKLKKNYNELLSLKNNLKKLNSELEVKVKERTRELTDSEERFRMVAIATNDVIWDWNLMDNSLWLSENYRKKFGYDQAKDSVSRDAWFEKVHPDDRNKVQESIWESINKNEIQWSAEYRFLLGKGTYADILDRGYILQDEYGTPFRMIGSMLDITDLNDARKIAESSRQDKYFLAQSMPLILWTANPEGSVDFINDYFASYSNLDIKDALGTGWQRVIHHEDLARLFVSWKKAIQLESDFDIELRMSNCEGEYQWHLLRVKARNNKAGKLMQWVGTGTNIHDQKHTATILEQKVKDRTMELERINDELESSNIELQQFAFMASHDLKEPLRKIIMFGNMIRDKIHAEHKEGVYMEKIIASSMRMNALVEDLLSFSRISISALSNKLAL
ncbi:MAG: chemotaxis protein CheB, partial [Flavitalea sp.]